jgi:hypothetical protein
MVAAAVERLLGLRVLVHRMLYSGSSRSRNKGSGSKNRITASA